MANMDGAQNKLERSGSAGRSAWALRRFRRVIIFVDATTRQDALRLCEMEGADAKRGWVCRGEWYTALL
jgi:hypothetical protein